MFIIVNILESWLFNQSFVFALVVQIWRFGLLDDVSCRLDTIMAHLCRLRSCAAHPISQLNSAARTDPAHSLQVILDVKTDVGAAAWERRSVVGIADVDRLH